MRRIGVACGGVGPARRGSATSRYSQFASRPRAVGFPQDSSPAPPLPLTKNTNYSMPPRPHLDDTKTTRPNVAEPRTFGVSLRMLLPLVHRRFAGPGKRLAHISRSRSWRYNHICIFLNFGSFHFSPPPPPTTMSSLREGRGAGQSHNSEIAVNCANLIRRRQLG